jgi:hypothetical protein
VTVRWAARNPETQRFSGVWIHGDAQSLSDELAALAQHGAGYIEVALQADYPTLTLGFRGDAAVLHLFTSTEDVSLRRTLSQVSGRAEVPIMDTEVTFDQEFVLTLAEARKLLDRFIAGQPTGDGWIPL